MTGFYDLTPGRLCVHCGVELSRYRKTFCSNACREATPRAFVGNPKGRPARVGTVTEEFRTKLCGLWADGIPIAAMGARLGITKNSVAGFVHRWKLVPRGSPIIRTGPTKPRKVAARRKPPSPKSPPRIVPPHPPADTRRPEILPPAAPLHKDHTPPVAFSVLKTCQWISGETAPWVMCGRPTVQGSAWCEEHFRRVYVVPPRLRTVEALAA